MARPQSQALQGSGPIGPNTKVTPGTLAGLKSGVQKHLGFPDNVTDKSHRKCWLLLLHLAGHSPMGLAHREALLRHTVQHLLHATHAVLHHHIRRVLRKAAHARLPEPCS